MDDAMGAPGQRLVVRDNHEGLVIFIKLHQKVNDLPAAFGIRFPVGSSQNIDFRIVDQRPGNRDALLFSAG